MILVKRGLTRTRLPVVYRAFRKLAHRSTRHFSVFMICCFLAAIGSLVAVSTASSLFVDRAIASSASHPRLVHHTLSQIPPQSPLFFPPQPLASIKMVQVVKNTLFKRTIFSSQTISKGVVLSLGVLQTAAGPVQVSTLDVDLSNPTVHLGIVQAHNRLISSDEVVSSMANRTGAVAGINGDFFEEGGPGRPIGMVEINGKLVQSPTSYAVCGVTPSGGLTIGNESFSGSVTTGAATYRLSSVNIYNDASHGNLVLLTPDLGTPPPIAGDTVALLQATSNSSTTFSVRSVGRLASLSAVVGQYALVGNGKAGAWLLSHLHSGNLLKVRESIAPNQLSLAIGGGPLLIQNGAIYHDPNPPAPAEVNVRNPLTAISISSDGKHASLVVFDGRGSGPTRSVGLTHAQAAGYLLTHGAYAAMLFDSGGSSDMVARLHGQNYVSVVNWPSDKIERRVANGLFIYNR